MDSNVSDDKKVLPKTLNKQKSVANISLSKLSHRLTMRKKLHKRLTLVTDIMCFLGILGIILMIIKNELIFSQIHNNDTIVSWSIKVVISVSTVVLIGFIIEYHRLDISLYALNNSIENRLVTLTKTKILLIVVEILICAIHPMPRVFPHYSNESPKNTSSDGSTSTTYSVSYIYIDVVLGLPMFLRLYLLCRLFLYHSHLFLDASSRSIGYLNRISIDYFFLIKAYLEQWPIFCLSIFCIFIFLIGSWSLRACDYTSSNEHLTMQDSMWLFIETFTTVGYGDIFPSTYCGRTVAAMVSLVGILTTAVFITVLTQKLLMNRWEKYVHNFVLDVELAKERKIQAANVIKFAFLAWYIKKKNVSSSSFLYLQAQRRLFQAIRSLHLIKRKQGQLVDSCIDQIDLIATERNTNTQISGVTEQLQTMEVKMYNVEEKLVEMNININNIMNDIQKILSMLNKVAK
ncbi:unnamed protein product [Rotaria sp. Silwood2]|nr:unnamed protein product [Rotaria sp. Silwood2]